MKLCFDVFDQIIVSLKMKQIYQNFTLAKILQLGVKINS